MTADETRKRHEQARDQGAQAFRGGRKVDACPYRFGSMSSERASWMQGYEQAKAERGRGR